MSGRLISVGPMGLALIWGHLWEMPMRVSEAIKAQSRRMWLIVGNDYLFLGIVCFHLRLVVGSNSWVRLIPHKWKYKLLAQILGFHEFPDKWKYKLLAQILGFHEFPDKWKYKLLAQILGFREFPDKWIYKLWQNRDNDDGEDLESDCDWIFRKIWPPGSKYTGSWVDGCMGGVGCYLWPNGNRYEGGWKENKMSGPGVYSWASGRSVECQFVNNQKHGKARIKAPDGTVTMKTYKYNKEVKA